MLKKGCIFILLTTLVLLNSSYKLQATTILEPQVEPVQVVLLAGQSNMAGAGNYDELSEDVKQRIEKISHRVLLSFNGKPANPLSYYNNKPSEKYNFTKRFGPELLLGLTLAESNPNQEFLLIKRSQGGTALYGAWNPNWSQAKAKAVEKAKFKQSLKLYELHISDIKTNLEALKSQNKTYKIIGLAWMQGENDATLEVAAKGYKQNLKNLVTAYRSEFNVPEMPFVFGQINSRYGVKGGAKMVRDNMVQFAQEDSKSILIKTSTDKSWEDFPKHPDNVHYNAEGQKRLGIAFGKGLLNNTKKQNTSFVRPTKKTSLKSQAKEKIKTLKNLIKKAEKKNIDVLKEKTTVRTAEIFLKFADWDEKNIEANLKLFKKVQSFKKDAVKMANNLPNFEREDVILMLDDATKTLNLLIEKKEFRKPSPKVDWTKITLDKDQLTFNNRPIFITDYTWKPNTKELTEYHGDLDGFFITPTQVVSEDGAISKRIRDNLETKPDGSLGFIFMNHKNIPKWAKDSYGPNFSMREDTYTAYDIDNPGAKELQKKLLSYIVPEMAGKRYTKLGYMLCNEPHFYTYKFPNKEKLPWASGGVSQFTIQKFKSWLENKHKDINALNDVWKTNYSSFNDVFIDIPLSTTYKGTPIWYDWASFNMDRVTDWYTFLKSEITKHDPEAKVHLKIMPSLWTENKRVHGIDLEALTDLSGIVGNDSGADHTRIWGKPHEWEAHYAFEWRELCMGYDFMKSVSPNKINFNSELHYLSTVRSRNLYLDPKFARASFWLAHSYGMTASQIWYWPREADGSISKKAINDKGYAGSNNQQPRVTNEVATTLIDLNSYSEEIMAMQRQRKPLRIFYSKTSAINKKAYMDDLFELYEALHFEGTSLGFVTKDIINKQNNEAWDVILIHKTPYVTIDELNALQSYLNKGGTIIIDDESILKNEYGQAIQKLSKGKGTLINLDSVLEVKEKALSILKSNKLLPEVSVSEENKIGPKGCIWKVVKNKFGNNVLSVVNVGKSDATLSISLNGSDEIICKDLIKGIPVNNKPTLKPNDVFFVEVISKN
ncbi:sialate O-acetylesterase [Flavivirga abyssicola]|uniref:sialate O-acetylesterase n=1 Tax=Flavivirga abyssicola TaxID=3063533 RepID=UPI0026DF13E6|nr:sialate O-acetylesterase [Flavivirga sp. MEBiC07777]WVK13767.1 sialate O-acetylesterase [Flavivirga sp. MEBiC07777]